MGCGASRFEREKSVTGRCRSREHQIKQCVQKQHAFAAAHASYIRSLRDTGAALRQFGEGGEAKSETVGTDFPLDMEDEGRQQLAHAFSTPYFPPPLPHFLTPSFLSRAWSMPQFNFSSPHALSLAKTLIFSSPRNSFTYSQEESADADAGVRKSYYVKPPPPLPAQLATPPAPPSKASQWEFYNVFQLADDRSPAFPLKDEPGLAEEDVNGTPQAEELKTPLKSQKSSDVLLPMTELPEVVLAERLDAAPTSAVKKFLSTLKDIDDFFLKAYESGRDVARLLEGQRTHYLSSFDGYSDPHDHSARVLRVMSWGRHSHFASVADEATARALCGGEKETHASTLDKLLAWEKKLYDEVKVGEVIRVKLERKSVELKRLKRQEKSLMTLNKTKAVVKDLQTRYLVEVQAVDAASSEVQKLRDDCLHSQLVDLVQRSMMMWQAMLNCHQQQHQLIGGMQLNDTACVPMSTNDSHTKNTLQLENEIQKWHQNLEKLIATQKDYMHSVHLWLHLHITEIESGGKGVRSSPQKLSSPPVYSLCKSWLSALDQVPSNMPLNALRAFSGIIKEVKAQQAAELKQKQHLDQLRKELDRKEQLFMRLEAKYKKFYRAHAGLKGTDTPGPEDMDRGPLKEKEMSLRLLREKVENESEKYEQMCARSGNMAVSSLQNGLPPVLSAMKDFAETCFQTYMNLLSRTMSEEATVLQISY